MNREAEPGPEVFQIGELVTWRHQPRGGWGYIYPVDGEVVQVEKATVTIRVKKKNGMETQVVVRPASLVRRENEN